MAFSASTVWEVQTTGNDTVNGGGFDPGNANGFTDGAATNANTSAPVFTSASYSFVAGDVGHWVYVRSGTNWTPGWYKIASVSAGAATLTGTIGLAVLAGGGLSTVIGCATVASPTTATWMIDYSQAAPPFAFTDLVISAVTNTDATSAGIPLGKQMVGNIIAVTSGTGFTVQRVQLVSIPSGVIGRFEKSLGTLGSTGGTGSMGGPILSPGVACGLMVGGNDLYIKAGTYSITSTTPNIVAGRLDVIAGASIFDLTRVVGYGVTRWDNPGVGARPLIQKGGSFASQSLVLNNADSLIMNLSTDGGFASATTGFWLNANGSFTYFCDATRCTNSGFFQNSTQAFSYWCYAFNNSGGSAFTASHAVFCVATGNTFHGFRGSNLGSLIGCVAINNTGANISGFDLGFARQILINCVSYGNTLNGFHRRSSSYASLYNCIAYGNGAFGFSAGAQGHSMALTNCAGGNNVSGNVTLVDAVQNSGFIPLTVNPFNNADGGDFTLNTLPGGGALLRQLGYPTALPGLPLTLNKSDIGAVQNGVAVGGWGGGFGG